MGLPIGFLDSTPLGDRFITVNPRAEAKGASDIPIHDSQTAELPVGSPNWQYFWEAIFSKNESGSGPVGQWNLHAHFDAILEAIEQAVQKHVLAWIGDEDRVGVAQADANPGTSVMITLAVGDIAALDLTEGDYVYCESGAYGKVDVIGDAPPHTIRAETLVGSIATGQKVYRAWRIYTACRALDWDPGKADSSAMDGFRDQERLRLDSNVLPLRSTGA